jgi:integrase
MGRSRWGSVRKLPSGRYQARYRVDGLWKSAPATFRTKGDADAFLAATRADIDRGIWTDPAAGQIELAVFSERWLSDRPHLRPRTRDLYRGLLRLHILPTLGDTALGRLTPAQVRQWRAAMIKDGRPGPSTIAKSYRLLHAICETAVEDSVIARNPCVIKGASVERPVERPVATIEEVYALADAIEPRYRAMLLLATFCGLRVGELRALRQRNLDLLHRTVAVVEQYQQLADGTLLLGPPKTDAGRRKVAIPEVIISDLEEHLATWCTPGRDNLVFPGSSGRPFRTATLHAAWQRALKATGTEGLRFHDLRHTGNTLAAATGASTKELMARMGHASPRAALIYQHATKDRDAQIAAGLSALVERTREQAGS